MDNTTHTQTTLKLTDLKKNKKKLTSIIKKKKILSILKSAQH